MTAVSGMSMRVDGYTESMTLVKNVRKNWPIGKCWLRTLLEDINLSKMNSKVKFL